MEYTDIIKDIKKGNFKPVYVLMGEESFFIDEVSEAFEKYTIPKDMKSFNETIMYGLDSDIDQVISMAKSYPMIGEKQLILIKEAQKLEDIDKLESYCKQPQETTVLVLCYKYKTLDKRKAVTKAISKNGLVFSTPKIWDNQVPFWINKIATSQKIDLSDHQVNLLSEFLGADLARIKSAVEKLKLASNGEEVTDQLIEDQIGVNKDYNMYTMQLAILNRDFKQCMKIADYFTHNPKAMNIIPAIGGLYNVYTKMIKLSYAKDKSKNAAKDLGISYGMYNYYYTAIKKYNLKKQVANISILKTYDLKAKGIDSSSQDEGLILEMIQKLII